MTAAILKNVLGLVILAALALAWPASAADLVALSPQTWDRYIPQGKEVDGDLRRLRPDQRPARRGGRPPQARAGTRT